MNHRVSCGLLRHLGCVGAVVLLAGCALAPSRIAGSGPDYHPGNVFLYAPGLAPDVKRVALLPIASDSQRPDIRDACAKLDPILETELIRTRKFEVISVSHELLRSCTGQTAWKGTEALPRDFFDSVRRVSGCDAVLLCQLTAFRGYKPLAVGWRMRLVDARTGQTLWAVDELLDARESPAPVTARFCELAGLTHPGPDGEEWAFRNSPRQFCEYAAAQVLATLPKR